MPCLELGGKCVAGSTLLVKPARDKKGELVGSDAIGQYGTPKCEFIAQLCLANEPENAASPEGDVWVSAHPSHGEAVARALLESGAVLGGGFEEVRPEVSNFCGFPGRIDFVCRDSDGALSAVEVKSVVDTDYDPDVERPDGAAAPLWLGPRPYERAAIFPYGRSNQKGPDGEKVVSARAIRQLGELRELARGARACPETGARVRAALLFVVVRADASSFRANHDACPSFARHLAAAVRDGVDVRAVKVRWGTGADEGVAFVDPDDATLPVVVRPEDAAQAPA